MPLTLPSPLFMPPLSHLPSLSSCCALPTCLQCCSHTGPILNATYHPYTPAAPSRCDSNAALTCRLQSLCSRSALKISIQHQHLISTLAPPYASAPPPCLLCHLSFFHFCIRSNGYGGLLAYMLNTITEIF
ncbi:hypothetical protein O181_111242 [Austropuccinia psidii MF-1]|uniref:Uncharacterized protein n=1 Tax=Austropuccinia psidii MF-1 TaxID=1389203 RepID=A0A9Q3JZK1_9BASI|nr:hypothetical protein [Austropuccinia psidii MF-1]